MRRPPIPGLVMADSWLQPYARQIRDRQRLFDSKLKKVRHLGGSLEHYASAYHYFGFNRDRKTGEWIYREWAPGAQGLYLIGDFNGWDRSSHVMLKDHRGVWEIRLHPNALKHGDLVKVHVVDSTGESKDRIPAWIHRCVQNPETYDFAGQIWCPDERYEWVNKQVDLSRIDTPYIYEAHIGMSGEEERVHTYREFADQVLPRVAQLGYNTIQLMAIQEHPYYGSFGYHVSSFFAPSSRFGTPDDLKYLVDKAHGLNVAVLLDIVHSHSVKNEAEGLSHFDGTSGMYFMSGSRGVHPDWDSCCFDYGRDEVMQFLLSNLKWWLDEYHFDGFRFDGVTSMLYYHRGHEPFEQMGDYFGTSVDPDAVAYLQLANTLIQRVKPGAFVIGEDMSGMPGLCRPVDEGGIGFSHRLAMGIPDYWIKLIKDEKDEDWSIGNMWHTLINRRYGEPNIAYAESHDQALVGDKTIAFQLMDSAMYWKMGIDEQSLIIDRGIALHKMIRLASLSAGGEGWLNFMGNEFGHPEWIDFPREGNNWSYRYCRRQWSLVDRQDLKYKWLNAFDKAMITLAKSKNILGSMPATPLSIDEQNKVLIFTRANLVFVFNWSGDRAIPNYQFQAPQAGEWRVILDSDNPIYGGFNRQDTSISHFTDEQGKLSVYTLPRTVTVLEHVWRGGMISPRG